jgi:hypothetical protein
MSRVISRAVALSCKGLPYLTQHLHRHSPSYPPFLVMSSLLAQTLLYPIPLFFVWPSCYLIHAAFPYLLYDQIHAFFDLLRSHRQSLVWPLYILSALMISFHFLVSSTNYVCNPKQVRAFRMCVFYDCVSCETQSPYLSLVPHGSFDMFHTLAPGTSTSIKYSPQTSNSRDSSKALS